MTYQPGPPADVRALSEADRWTLVFVRELKHPPETVWAALTRAEQLAAWAPFTADRDLDRPGDATLTMIDGDGAEPMPATVTMVEPPWLLEYTWGEDRLRWQLEVVDPGDAGTRLTLRHTLTDREWLPKVAAGWHMCLDVAARLLDGAPIPPIRGRDALNYGWQDLADAYAKDLT
jgi:uncharacterized protein YndB with AHSA1/START domain